MGWLVRRMTWMLRPARARGSLTSRADLSPGCAVRRLTVCRGNVKSSAGRIAWRYGRSVTDLLLGYPRVRSDDGSWTEWGSMVGMPVETD
jgi:3-mercaptopyruvate sulfurtransferase SseA